MVSTHDLLLAYDQQLRGVSGFGQGVVDRDGPLVRLTGGHRGFVSAPADLGPTGWGLTDAEVDALIARTIAHYAQVGQPFEWKIRSHDRPADLTQRLVAAGFVAEPVESVMIGEVELIPPPVEVAGVRIRRSTEPADMARIAALHSAVWNADCRWLADELLGRIARNPDMIAIFLAEEIADGSLVAAAWLELEGQDFAGLWGGSTLPAFRGRGIYRALVAHRAQLARELRRRYLQVDASAESAPILARLGLRQVTTTTPYVWSPLAG
jgi:GNAT superfamily N-acetyltransferase